jgi:hypothetical protein
MRIALFGASTATAVLVLIATSVPARAQQSAAPKCIAPRTADNHPDMQGAWAR